MMYTYRPSDFVKELYMAIALCDPERVSRFGVLLSENDTKWLLEEITIAHKIMDDHKEKQKAAIKAADALGVKV